MQGGSTEFEGCITHGPWGGTQGEEWVYRPENFIRKISIRRGGVVDSIKFQTYLNGEIQTSLFGGKGGNRTDTICIDYPDEYLVSVSGTTGDYDGSNVVKSICFITNQNSYGPYGSCSGTRFSHDGKGGAIVGFHGRASEYLSSIGVHVMPKSLAFGPVVSTYEHKIMNELCSSMSTIAMARNAGPWGAGGGKPWDDGVFSTVKQVCIHVGDLNVIYAIQFEYLKKNGKSVFSQIHGGTDGVKGIQLVDFEDEDEYLGGVSGFYGPVKGYDGLEAIGSISFHTNKKIYGPFGEERGAGLLGSGGSRKEYQGFSSTASRGKVVGFHGRENGFLGKIGVHMEYF
ncbi:hypothetical protein SSX86_000957 [Deinandra increscens subsp. villosa]|uniref:Jacalin-type lectin domain-containing protein n=1 Tax=Deinandra increscens subsp. villosa TaxID=3103831 RepID=A0AAP0DQE2_9ASTR